MKKTLLFLGALALGLGVNAQEGVEKELYTNSSLLISDTSVACNSDDGSSNNHFYKKFNLSSLGVEDTFHIQQFGFGIEGFQSVAGPTATVQVDLYKTSVNTFPATWGTNDYTLLADAFAEISTEDVGELVYAEFDQPYTVEANEIIVADLYYGPYDGQLLFIGSNAAADTEATYLSAEGCDIFSPTPVASVGFPDMKAIMILKGTEGYLGVEDVVFEGFKHFTSNNTLHISNDTAIQTVEIYNVLGQKVIVNNVNASNVSVDLASLTNGVYITKVTVDGIEKTFKIIK